MALPCLVNFVNAEGNCSDNLRSKYPEFDRTCRPQNIIVQMFNPPVAKHFLQDTARRMNSFNNVKAAAVLWNRGVP
jgi:hypothetical protein